MPVASVLWYPWRLVKRVWQCRGVPGCRGTIRCCCQVSSLTTSKVLAMELAPHAKSSHKRELLSKDQETPEYNVSVPARKRSVWPAFPAQHFDKALTGAVNRRPRSFCSLAVVIGRACGADQADSRHVHYHSFTQSPSGKTGLDTAPWTIQWPADRYPRGHSNLEGLGK